VVVQHGGIGPIDLEKDDCLSGCEKAVFKAGFYHVVEGLRDGSCGQPVGMVLKQGVWVLGGGLGWAVDDVVVDVHWAEAEAKMRRG
jgi:hypothetical protein